MEKLKYILLNERSQCEKAIYCMIPTNMTYWKRQNYEDSKNIVVARGWGQRRGMNRLSTEEF